MAQRNQGGSVLGFIVVAVVLAGLLIGGAYVVRQLTTQPQTPSLEPSPAQDDQKNQPKAEEKTTPEASKDKSEAPQSQADGLGSSGSTTTQLPKTGPENLLATVLALGILSGMVVSYARSRRPELSF